MNTPRICQSYRDQLNEIRQLVYNAELQLADACPEARGPWLRRIAKYRELYRTTVMTRHKEMTK